MEIDGSFELEVERTGWGDITLTLRRHDLRINLDPAEAARLWDLSAELTGVDAFATAR